jgi:hypothetical protein
MCRQRWAIISGYFVSSDAIRNCRECMCCPGDRETRGGDGSFPSDARQDLRSVPDDASPSPRRGFLPRILLLHYTYTTHINNGLTRTRTKSDALCRFTFAPPHTSVWAELRIPCSDIGVYRTRWVECHKYGGCRNFWRPHSQDRTFISLTTPQVQAILLLSRMLVLNSSPSQQTTRTLPQTLLRTGPSKLHP